MLADRLYIRPSHSKRALAHAVQKIFRQVPGFLSLHVFHQHAELVAAEAGDLGRPVGQRLHQLIGDHFQQFVTGGVAAGVVDDLELVQIQVEQRVLVFLCLGMLNGRLHKPLELLTVQELGEVVVARLVSELVVHVLEHALRSPLHERQVVVVEQGDLTLVQPIGHFPQRQLAILDAFAVHQHES